MIFSFRGLLFDLDGTLVQSLAAVERAWAAWLVLHGLDPKVVMPQIHGRRAIDSIRIVAPHLDAELEHERLEELEATDTEGVEPTVGAIPFLRSLDGLPWGIVTSGTLPVASARLRAGGFPRAGCLVTGNDVARGKPSPDPFLRGAELLRVPADSCVAFEDTGAGARSARAAGMKVVLVGDDEGDCDGRIRDFRDVAVVRDPILGLRLEILA